MFGGHDSTARFLQHDRAPPRPAVVEVVICTTTRTVALSFKIGEKHVSSLYGNENLWDVRKIKMQPSLMRRRRLLSFYRDKKDVAWNDDMR